MSQFDNTALAATIDQKWDMEVEEARYANAVIMPLVNNKSDIVQKSGDTINVTIDQKLTIGTVGADGSFVPQNYTPTKVPITVDQWKQSAIETTDKAEAQSFWDPKSVFPKNAGKAMAVDYDQYLAGLWSGVLGANILGKEANPQPFDITAARIGLLTLANLNIPKDSLQFVLPPIAWFIGLYSNSELTAANSSGMPKSANITGARFPLLGTPAYESNVLTTVGTSIKGLLFHKQAFAIGMQYNNDIKRADRTASLVFSAVVAMQSLYGAKTIRSDHAVVFNIRNS